METRDSQFPIRGVDLPLEGFYLKRFLEAYDFDLTFLIFNFFH